MYGRRCNQSSLVSSTVIVPRISSTTRTGTGTDTGTSTRMTIGFFVICLCFHGLLADILTPPNTPTISLPIPRKSSLDVNTNPKSTSRTGTVTTKTESRSTRTTTTTTTLPITPISFSANPPDEQLQRPLQPQNNPRKSIGYVAEWESEGSSSSFLDERDEPFGSGTEQVSPLGKGGKVKTKTSSHRQNQYSSHPQNSNEADELVESEDHPSRRVGPGTWHDSHGSWWLFGGQGPVPDQSENPTSKTNANSHSKSTSSPNNINKSIHYLSDLWAYDHETSSWRLVFRPESENSPIHSSYPENLGFPHVCGSTSHGHIAVFGGGGVSGATTSLRMSQQHNSEVLPFTDDNVVWLFDIPINKKDMTSSSSSEGQGKISESAEMSSPSSTSSWDPSGGLWTSYICCDACLPDGNTTLEFCPRFSREPILWCGQDSLMALQINRDQPRHPPTSSTKTISKTNRDLTLEEMEEANAGETNSAQFNEDIKSIESASNSKSKSNSKKVEDKSKRDSNTKTRGMTGNGNESRTKSKLLPQEINSSTGHSSDSGADADSTHTSSADTSGSQIHIGKINSHGNTRSDEVIVNAGLRAAQQSLRATWWKFDLAATEWEKMPEVSVTTQALDLIEAGDCRTVSDTNMVYILCPSKENVLERSVLVFDPSHNSIDLLEGRMELNNAFRDRKVWQLGRSTLHALRTENQMTVLFLAYHKLLDLWIHDHSSNRLYSVENVWKGSSLHAFQRTSSFYKITISFPSTSTSTSTTGSTGTGTSVKNSTDSFFSSSSSSNALKKNPSYSFFMANPRSKLFEFKDNSPTPPTPKEKGGKRGEGQEQEKQSSSHHASLSSGGFHITIVTDQSVFLPARDASFLINTSNEDEDIRSNDEPMKPTTHNEGGGSSEQNDKNSNPQLKPNPSKIFQTQAPLTKTGRSGSSTTTIPSAPVPTHSQIGQIPSQTNTPVDATIESSNSDPNPKPNKIIMGKALLRKSKVNYNRTGQNSSGYSPSSSKSSDISSGSPKSSNISISPIIESSLVNMTTTRTTTTATATTPPPISPTQLEQKLTLRRKFNLNPLESPIDFTQQQQQQPPQLPHQNTPQQTHPAQLKNNQKEAQSQQQLSSINPSPTTIQTNLTSDPLSKSKSIVQHQQRLLNGNATGTTKRTTMTQQRQEDKRTKTKTTLQTTTNSTEIEHTYLKDSPPHNTNANTNNLTNTQSQSDLNLTKIKDPTMSMSTPVKKAIPHKRNSSTSTNSNVPLPTARATLSLENSTIMTTTSTDSTSTTSTTTTMTITMTKKLIKSPRRIPFRNLNGSPVQIQGGTKDLGNGVGVGKIANLLAVKKAGNLAKSESEPEPGTTDENPHHVAMKKSPEEVTASLMTETETAAVMNESLRRQTLEQEQDQLERNRNRVSSWNSSRGFLSSESLPDVVDARRDERIKPRQKTKIKLRPTTTTTTTTAKNTVEAQPLPQQEAGENQNGNNNKNNLKDDSSIHVTLSYTMLSHDSSNPNPDNDYDSLNDNDNDNDRNRNRVRSATPSTFTPHPRLETSDETETEDREDTVVESLEEEEEGSERRSNSLTYGSSEIVFDSRDTVRPIGIHESMVPGMNASYSSMLFFAISLSIFATFGIVLFVRRCVKCPPRRQSVLIKEPPPIRYSVIPDELSYHMPIV